MQELTPVALATAFAAGTISFLSPCVLPIVPGYLSYLAGQTVLQSGPREQSRPLLLSLLFVMGFTTVFVLLGAGASYLGQLVSSFRYEAGIVGGFIILLFGLFMTGILRPLFAQMDYRFLPKFGAVGPLQAYILGIAFGFGWTPCIGPVLGSILTVTTSSGSSQGMTLLFTYALGLGLPFVLAAAFLDRFSRALPRAAKWSRVVQAGSGLVMIAIGILMLTGKLPIVAGWLMEAFPGFANIG